MFIETRSELFCKFTECLILSSVKTSNFWKLEKLTFPLGDISMKNNAEDSTKHLVQLILIIICYGQSKQSGKHLH